MYEFSNSTFVIKDQAIGRILASGNKQGNLYVLNTDVVTSIVSVRSRKVPEGHMAPKVLSSKNVIDVSKW